MKFTETKIPGVCIIGIEYTPDERGFFARTWDDREFEDRGLRPGQMVQSSTSFNPHRGTLRGMHFQKNPHEEAKLVRCTQGVMYDVAVDLRPDSPTYTKWVAVELSAENRNALYIPEGCAHGYQTLSDATEVLYMMSEYFHPDSASGVRYDDPAFKIERPETPTRTISAKDHSWPDWQNP